jgi:hypothetical protein
MSLTKRSAHYERMMEEERRREDNSFDAYQDWQYHEHLKSSVQKAQELIAQNEVRLTPDMLARLNKHGKR